MLTFSQSLLVSVANNLNGKYRAEFCEVVAEFREIDLEHRTTCQLQLHW